ncbi:hypothetical protein BZA77DRAFT_64150 [Pyronema omphalodes]|nr:hypothetical protein BZA77DRAFT_64150 [Pyronema omphalodes]
MAAMGETTAMGATAAIAAKGAGAATATTATPTATAATPTTAGAAGNYTSRNNTKQLLTPTPAPTLNLQYYHDSIFFISNPRHLPRKKNTCFTYMYLPSDNWRRWWQRWWRRENTKQHQKVVVVAAVAAFYSHPHPTTNRIEDRYLEQGILSAGMLCWTSVLRCFGVSVLRCFVSTVDSR